MKIIIATISLCLVLTSVLGADDTTPSVQQYRVIFNCDGYAVAKDANGDLNQWIENLFGP